MTNDQRRATSDHLRPASHQRPLLVPLPPADYREAAHDPMYLGIDLGTSSTRPARRSR